MKKLYAIILVFCISITLCSCELNEEEIKSIVSDVTVALSEEYSENSSSVDSIVKEQISNSSEATSSALSKKKPLEKVVAKYGNSAGNLLNGGCATIQGKYIYYSTDTGLYKTNGEKYKKLSDDQAYRLNVCGDWLYFLSNTKECYRIKTDGENREVFLDNASDIYIADGWVYYETYEKDGLHRIKTDKTQDEHIIKNHQFSNLNIVDGKIYWGDNIDMYVANCDGSNIVKYPDVGSQQLIIYNGLKYTSGNLDVENIDGTDTKTLVPCGAMDIVIQDDWIYFIYSEKEHRLYKIKTDGTGLTELTDHGVIVFCVVGEWIYYSPLRSVEYDNQTHGWADGHRRMRIDGSKNIKIK